MGAGGVGPGDSYGGYRALLVETLGDDAGALAIELGTPLTSRAGGADLTFEAVLDAYHAGDPAARTAALEAARYLGQAVAGLIGALNIARIVLDGPVTAFGEEWLAALRDEAGRRSFGLLGRDTEIVVGLLSPNVVVLGASALLITSELGLSLSR